MFSLTELNDVAWLLFLLMAAWVLVNALVDLSSDRASMRKSKNASDEGADQHD